MHISLHSHMCVPPKPCVLPRRPVQIGLVTRLWHQYQPCVSHRKISCRTLKTRWLGFNPQLKHSQSWASQAGCDVVGHLGCWAGSRTSTTDRLTDSEPCTNAWNMQKCTWKALLDEGVQGGVQQRCMASRTSNADRVFSSKALVIRQTVYRQSTE